jgi:hypothetical protein
MSVQKEQIFMNIMNAKNSTGIIAGITGLLFALLYVGLEILTENPEATNSISVWHFPLIWLLAGIFFYSVFYAVGTVRGGKVKERGDHFQLQCCCGRPARIVLGISYARRPDAVLWWERLLSTCLSFWVRR